jgi:hypothetical protein
LFDNLFPFCTVFVLLIDLNSLSSFLPSLSGLMPPVAHLDMKSPNIMLTRTPSTGTGQPSHAIYAKIADFGSAVAMKGRMQQKRVDNPRWQGRIGLG